MQQNAENKKQIREGFILQAWDFIRKNKDLKSSTKIVLMELCDKIDVETGKCDLSIGEIAFNAGVSKRTVQSALKNLKDLGILFIQNRVNSDNPKIKDTSIYTLVIAQTYSLTKKAKFAQSVKKKEQKEKVKLMNLNPSEEELDKIDEVMGYACDMDIKLTRAEVLRLVRKCKYDLEIVKGTFDRAFRFKKGDRQMTYGYLNRVADSMLEYFSRFVDATFYGGERYTCFTGYLTVNGLL